ncbi:hypothetical protein [Vagococcus salmoninarum]|uniref:hypothetical protein n=1 Tax=Vagococcus salmoninarum TaxID=2739 RepID=UPI003F98A408
MTQTVKSALQTTYRLIMAQNRRGQSDVVGRMNRKRLTVNESDVRELVERKTKGGLIKGLNLVLPNYLFLATKPGESSTYQLDNLVVDAEFCLISKDQTCGRYYRIQSVRQREVSQAWYIKLV